MLILQIGERPLRREQDSAVLERHGIHRECTETLGEAVGYIELYGFDVIVVDLDLRNTPGPEMIRAIRAISSVPIIGITTSPDPAAKIVALDLGADDILTQLCGIDEILARIRAVVRRRYGHADSTLRCGRLELSLVAHEARVDAIPLRLGPKEYLLLEFLIMRRGSAVSKTACMNHLYGMDDYPEAKTIDVVLCRLRKRLTPYGLADIIESVWGFGYKLKDADAGWVPPRIAAAEPRRGRLVVA